MPAKPRIPASTYRLQIQPDFTLRDAAALVDYLAGLGVDWLYLSPILQATKGSAHGYDVTDPHQVDESRGGPDALAALSAAAKDAGLGIVVDIVPNHQAFIPEQNPWVWSLLREGQESPYAQAFDVDWAAGGGRILLPVLGDSDDERDELAKLQIVDGELRYYDNRFPIAPGTLAIDDLATPDDGDPGSPPDPAVVHDRQHYRLVNWRRADSELNYRRFFGVNTLAGIRVEVPWVYDETHREVARWFQEDLVDGLRIDHPDGLANPRQYLHRLAETTDGAWVIVEKILEPGERLPETWECAGTTGYDALADIDRLLVDPAGRTTLTDVTPVEPYTLMVARTKRGIADGILRSEVLRLARLIPAAAGLNPNVAADALAELLSAFPVYRSYLPEGAEYLAEACALARVRRPELAAAIDTLLPLLNPALQPQEGLPDVPATGPADAEPEPDADLPEDGLPELAVRFQQTSGMIMAKGVEDTAFYQYTRLTSLNEVGADPSIFAIMPEQLQERLADRQQRLPASMTTLTTHDTKRSEDTRARINVLSELADEWAQTLAELRRLAPLPDDPLSDLLWQAIIGAWPLSRERARDYALKAAREAGTSTSWTESNEEFENQLMATVDAAWNDPAVSAVVRGFAERLDAPGWSNSLSAKLIQLTMPGIPDVYQGTELWDRSLVDPDNRRPVDFGARRETLARIDDGDLPAVGPDGAVKLLVTSRALRLRRDRTDLFTRYSPVEAIGPAASHLFAFDRGGAITLATRLPVGLERDGGWQDTVVPLPEGIFENVLTGGRLAVGAGGVAVAEILDRYPVALLVPVEALHVPL